MKQSNFYQSLLTGAYPARPEICYCTDEDCTHDHPPRKPQRDEPQSDAGGEMKPEHERAELGIDGNCGFALLGENIQEGEAEFVEIGEAEPGRKLDAGLIACKQALEKLKKRLNLPAMSYYFGRSHPYGR